MRSEEEREEKKIENYDKNLIKKCEKFTDSKKKSIKSSIAKL